MLGRELIIYILQNGLEDEEVFKDGTFIGFMNDDQVAAKFNVGPATVRAWYELGMIKGFIFGDSVFYSANVKDPREEIEEWIK